MQQPRFAGTFLVQHAGRPQGLVGQVPGGLGARALSAGPQQKPSQTSKSTIFRKSPGQSLAKAWLPRRWGPGGKRSRDTAPTAPAHPPPGILGLKGERKRVTVFSQGWRISIFFSINPNLRPLNPKPLNSSFHSLFHYPQP